MMCVIVISGAENHQSSCWVIYICIYEHNRWAKKEEDWTDELSSLVFRIECFAVASMRRHFLSKGDPGIPSQSR